MARLLLGRLVQIALTLALLSAAIWLLMGLMPGDPIDQALTADPRLTAADAERLRALHGLDRPLHERYLAWATALLRGEFGHSRLFARPVAEVLGPALLSSLALLGGALGLAAGIGIGLGALAAARPRWAPWIAALAILAQSTPTFGRGRP